MLPNVGHAIFIAVEILPVVTGGERAAFDPLELVAVIGFSFGSDLDDVAAGFSYAREFVGIDAVVSVPVAVVSIVPELDGVEGAIRMSYGRND